MPHHQAGCEQSQLLPEPGAAHIRPLNFCVFLMRAPRSVLFCTFPMYEFSYVLESVVLLFQIGLLFFVGGECFKVVSQYFLPPPLLIFDQFPRS